MRKQEEVEQLLASNTPINNSTRLRVACGPVCILHLCRVETRMMPLTDHNYGELRVLCPGAVQSVECLAERFTFSLDDLLLLAFTHSVAVDDNLVWETVLVALLP